MSKTLFVGLWLTIYLEFRAFLNIVLIIYTIYYFTVITGKYAWKIERKSDRKFFPQMFDFFTDQQNKAKESDIIKFGA